MIQLFLNGQEVHIFEKNDRLGKKLFITGKGRCNVTNAGDMDNLFESVRTNSKFLYSAFYSFSNEQVMDFFETAFVYSVDMPGRYFKGNAVDFIDGNPMWKVDAYRLMNGEVALAATTRKANVLIFILTFAAIAALLLLFSRRLPGRRR